MTANQVWDNVNMNAGHDFNLNFSINGSGDITDSERKERGMDHSHGVVSAASDSMVCRKTTNHGACQLDLTIELQSSARERVLKVHCWNSSEDNGLQRL